MKPKVSLIILTWNTAKITQKCVRSINRHLKGKLDYEIIVADNASTDNTIDLISQELNCRLVKNNQNYGFSKGNNLAAKTALGKYLFFVNSDIEFTDSYLTNLLDYFDRHENIGAIGPMFLNPDLTPQASVFPEQTVINAFRQYFLNVKLAYSNYIPTGKKPLEVPNISGGALLITKELFNQVGGWDERYYFYFEDLEMCRQIKRMGKKIVFYPMMKVIHHHGASGKNLADPQNQWRRLVPSSKIYHGLFRHYLITFILWSGQKLHSLFP